MTNQNAKRNLNCCILVSNLDIYILTFTLSLVSQKEFFQFFDSHFQFGHSRTFD